MCSASFIRYAKTMFFALSQPGPPHLQKDDNMKNNDLKQRLQKDRTMVPVSIRMPQDVVADLKRVAPQLGFSGYQPLIRAYVGQGLRQDLARLESAPGLNSFIESLLRQGVDEHVIAEAMAGIE